MTWRELSRLLARGAPPADLVTAFYLNEAKFELPDGRRIEDRTVTFLVGRSPRGAALMLLVERRPHAATSTLREAVDEHGRELERGYLGYAVLFDREVEVAGRPAIDVGARWRPERRALTYTRRVHLLVGETRLILTAEAPLSEREDGDRLLDHVVASFRLRDEARGDTLRRSHG